MLIDAPFTTILNKYRKTIYHGSLEIMLNFQATPTKLMIDIFPKFDQCDTEMQFTYKLAIVNSKGNHCQKTNGTYTIPLRGQGFNVVIVNYDSIEYLRKYLVGDVLTFFCHFDIVRSLHTDSMIRALYFASNAQYILNLERDLEHKNTQLLFLEEQISNQEADRIKSQEAQSQAVDPEIVFNERLKILNLSQLKNLAAQVVTLIKEFEQCPVCFDKDRDSIILPCCHTFCNMCLTKVLSCPICRGPCITIKKLH